jgi:hypothetical protein
MNENTIRDAIGILYKYLDRTGVFHSEILEVIHMLKNINKEK